MKWKTILLSLAIMAALAFAGCAKKVEPEKFDPQPVQQRADQATDEADQAGK